jgi:hypothetical protein
MPNPAACRPDTACIEGVGDLSQARCAAFAYGFEDRKDAGCELIGVSHLYCPTG